MRYSIIVSRVLETALLVGVIIIIEKGATGLNASVLVLNVDFSFGIVHTGSAIFLNTRLFGYLLAFVGTIAQAEVRPVPLLLVSLLISSVEILACISETLRALGLASTSARIGGDVFLLALDWGLLIAARLGPAVGAHGLSKRPREL